MPRDLRVEFGGQLNVIKIEKSIFRILLVMHNKLTIYSRY